MLASTRRVPVALRCSILSRPTSASLSLQASRFSTKQISLTPPRWGASSRSLRSLHTSNVAKQTPAAAASLQSERDDSQSQPGAITRFSELAEKGLVNRTVVNTINRSMGFDEMTEVQSRTISEALTGNDVLAQAKTGTGKTMAFLLPIVQRILQEDPKLASYSKGRFDPDDLKAIVISPTRELAEQIAVEAKKLTRDTGVKVQTGVGGTQKSMHLSVLHREGCNILVGTPGRLKDLLTDPQARVSAPSLHAFVLDEADRLLDQGFLPEIQEIQDLLPNVGEIDRQTLLFSATIPKDVVRLARTIMKPDLHYVRTVQEDEIPTHELVEQKAVLVPSYEQVLPTLLEFCSRCIKESQDPATGQPNFKAIVYFNTTAETTAVGHIFDNIAMGIRSRHADVARSMGLQRTQVVFMNSRLTQSQRTLAADTFRRAKSAILMSSDVTARGMDFPNVTHVIQVGAPRDRDSYIHRIGRTARAGKSGQAWVIAPQLQAQQLGANVRGLPVKSDDSLDSPMVTFEEGPDDMVDLSDPAKKHYLVIQDAARGVNKGLLAEAYKVLLSSNMSNVRSKADLVAEVNQMAKVNFAFTEPPAVDSGWAGRSGMAGVKGITVRTDSGYSSQFRDRHFGEDSRYGDRRQDRFGDRRESRFGDRFGDKRDDRFGDRFGDRRDDRFGARRESGYENRGQPRQGAGIFNNDSRYSSGPRSY